MRVADASRGMPLGALLLLLLLQLAADCAACPPAPGNYSILASKGHPLKPPYQNFSCASSPAWNRTLTEPTSSKYLSGLGAVVAYSADREESVTAAWGFCNNGDYDAYHDYCSDQFEPPLRSGIVASEARGCVMRTGTLRDLAALTRANWSAFRVGDEQGSDPFCMKPPCYSDTNYPTPCIQLKCDNWVAACQVLVVDAHAQLPPLKTDDEPDLTPKMMKSMVKAWINNFDMDRDGFLDRDEVSLWMTNEQGNDDEKRTDNMMNMIDTDGDTLCSKTELKEFAQLMKDMGGRTDRLPKDRLKRVKRHATKDEV